MSLKSKPRAPERQTRRPGLGNSVVRGLFTMARLYKQYSQTGYIPLKAITGKDRVDLRRAMHYCWRLCSWKYYLDKDREKERRG